MRRVGLFWLGVLGLLGGCAGGARDASSPGFEVLSAEVAATAAALREQGLADGRAYQLVGSLTAEVGPRLAGTPGDRAAVAWALRTLDELGFDQVRAEPVTVPHWERGEAEGWIVGPDPQPVVLAALGGSVATPEGGLEAEVVGAASLEELEQLAPSAVEGRIAFIHDPMERTRDGSGYGRAVAKRHRGAAVAAGKGARAVLIRSAGTSTHRVAHTGSLRYADGVPPIPAAALSNLDADRLAARLADGGPVRFHLRLTSRHLGEAESANVLGEVPGRERPEEIVLLACHLDSWDLGTGAVDDGAGCAIVMAAARLIRDLPQPPRRSLRVVLYANEEFGLSGARAYAEAHREELARHLVAAESDFGAGPVWRFQTWIAPSAVPAAAEIARLLAPLGIEWGGNQGAFGADLTPLRPFRVPMVSLRQDGSRYFDVHHTADDTLDQVDPGELAQNVAAWAVFAYAAAEWPGDFRPAPEP